MKIFEKKNTIKILDEDIKDAQLSSMDFKDEHIKKRAFIDVLGARLAMKMFFSRNIEANNLYSLYTLHKVLSEIDIADIYYKNVKIDVRLVFNKEEIFIPKSHFKYDILPDIYAVLTLEDDMSSVKFLGYFEPKDLDKNNANKDFYFFENNKLQNPDTFKNFLENYTPEKSFVPSEQDSKFAEGKFLEYIDNQISTRNKQLLIKQLANNITLREKFVEFENFEILSNEAIKDKSFFKDNLLDIIGAQKVVEEEEVVENAATDAAVDNDLEELNINVEDDLPSINFDEGTDLIEPEIAIVEEPETKTKEKKAEPEFIFESDFVPESDETDVQPLEKEDIQSTAKTEDQSEFEKIKAQMGIGEDDEEIFALNNLPLDKLGINVEDLNKKETEEKEQSIEDKFSENLVSFEDMLPDKNKEKKITSEQEESIEAKIRAIEEMEERENNAGNPIETSSNANDDSSQFISQVDDFLNDINLSSEQKALLEKSIDFDEDLIQETTKTKETQQPQDELQIAAFADETTTDKPLIPTETEESENKTKDPLKVLFEKENLGENFNEKPLTASKVLPPELYKNKKMVMAASIAGLVLFSTVIGISAMKNSQNSMPQDMANAPMATDAQQAAMPQDDMNMPAATDQSMPYPEQNASQSVQSETGQVSGDMGKAVSDAFLSEPVNATISKIAWEVPEDLAYNDSFRKYLQIAGKNLKLNLQNDLLLTNEMAYSNKIIVELIITKNSILQSSKILVSSGSQQIDKIVLQSVKETIKYLKVPSGELNRPTAEATLIINF